MNSLRWIVGGLALSAAQMTCTTAFDTTRIESPRAATVGGDVFGVVCERVDVSENPSDLDFSRGRPVCSGQTMDPCAPGANGGVGPRVCALAARRTPIISALDRVVPSSLYQPMDSMLVRLLPLYGPQNGRFTPGAMVDLPDGTQAPAEDLLPRMTRATSVMMSSLANNEEVVAAISRISHREGTRPLRLALGMTQVLLSYPRLGTTIERTMNLLREERPGRPAGAGNPQFNILMDVARAETATAQTTRPDATGTTLDAFLDLAFATDDSLSTNKPRLIVRRDNVGMPRVAQSGGSFPSPFVDGNSDGAADSQDGRFVAGNRPLNVPTPFATTVNERGVSRDTEGRAMANGGPIYEYVDMDRTVLGALMRDARPLVSPTQNTALRLARGASVLFGPRRMAMGERSAADVACPTEDAPNARCHPPAVQYNQFDSSGSAPALDLAHALGILLGHREIDSTLAVAEQLMSNHSSLLARNMAALLEIDNVSDMTPNARMAATANIYDDLIDILRDVARKPGLLEDILAAVEDPATEQWMRAFATFAVHKDRIEPDWSSQASMNASLASRTFSRMVDYARPDTTDHRVDATGIPSYGPNDNRSVFQRFLHLVYDLDGVRMCNKNGARITVNNVPILNTVTLPGTYGECEVFEVPDAAVFYLQTVISDGVDGPIGRLELKPSFIGALSRATLSAGLFESTLARSSEIEGFDLTPTPRAVNRMVFAPDQRRTPLFRDLLNPPTTRDGRPIREVHPGTIFAWETNNFYAGLRPLARAFNRHEGGLKLFVRMMSWMHLHWATREAGQYQDRDPNNAFFSKMSGGRNYEPIFAAAMRGDLPAASRELVRVLPTLRVGTRTGRDVIANAVRMVVDHGQFANLAYRDGRTTTTRSDGMTRVDQPALFYLFADAFNAMDTQFERDPMARAAWEGARSQLVDTFLGTTGTGSSTQFSNRQIPVVGRIALQWARRRLAAHQMAGDTDAWARGLSRRAAETTSGPTFAAAYDLLTVLDSDPMARGAVGDLLTWLLDDSGINPDNAFGITLAASGDVLQMLKVDQDIVPLLRGISPVFQRRVNSVEGPEIPDGLVPSALRMLDRAREYDTDHVLDRVLVNLVTRPNPMVPGDEPISVLGDAIAENVREVPNAGTPLSRNDVRRMFNEMDLFFSDRSRGLEQFYFIVQHRRL
ncbi:MAG: hypothetical protein JNK05_13975 [Myxococcales bacterium]|nr:hypothetical protein [Myxococcales bacterium]